MAAIITEDWTLFDIRNELLKAKEKNRIDEFKEKAFEVYHNGNSRAESKGTDRL